MEAGWTGPLMAKRCTPTLECLEPRQAFAVSPSLAGATAAVAVQAVAMAQAGWAPLVVQNVAGAAAAGSTARPAPGDAPQPTATPDGNVLAASGVAVAGSSSPRSAVPSWLGPAD